jgi:hypothetical protein
MKTEKLPEVPKQEPGDFYYHHLKLPYAVPAPAEEPPFEPDPTIEDMMGVSSDSGDQLGFVILRKDNTVEVVDALTGQHVRISFGKPKRQRKTAQTEQLRSGSKSAGRERRPT